MKTWMKCAGSIKKDIYILPQEITSIVNGKIFSKLFSGTSPRRLTSCHWCMAHTFVATTPTRGRTTSVVWQASMRPPAFTSSAQAWPTAARAFVSLARWAKMATVTWRIGVPPPTATRTRWPEFWCQPPCWMSTRKLLPNSSKESLQSY